jgi:drug/metabolite transporter (DMT)-like permease
VNKHIAMLMGALMLWGTSIPPTKWAMEALPPFTVTFLRLLLAALFLAPFVWRQASRQKNKPKIPWLRMWILSFTGVVGYFMINSIGLNMTSAVNASILNASLPLFTLLLSSLYLKEQITTSQWCGLFLGVVGVMVITVNPGLEVKMTSLVGDGIILLSCFVWAIYIVLMKRPKGEEKLSNEMFTFLTLFLGAVMLVPAVIGDAFGYDHYSISWKAMLSILFLALVPTIAAYWLWNHALKYISASSAGAYLNTLPLFSVLFSMGLLGESLTWKLITGAMFILLGVLGTEKRFQRTESLF